MSTPIAVKDLSHRILLDSRQMHQKRTKKKHPVSSSVEKQQGLGYGIPQTSHIPSSLSGSHLEAVGNNHRAQSSASMMWSSPRIEALERNLSKSERLRKKNKAWLKTRGEGGLSKPGGGLHESVITPVNATKVVTPPFYDDEVTLAPDLSPKLQFSSLLPTNVSSGIQPRPLSSTVVAADSLLDTTKHTPTNGNGTKPVPLQFVSSQKGLGSSKMEEHESSYLQVKDLPRAHEILADQVERRTESCCLYLQGFFVCLCVYQHNI